MATYTSYLNLEKPNTSETFNLLKMNANWDKIDNGVSALNSNIANLIKVIQISADNVSVPSGVFRVDLPATNIPSGYSVIGVLGWNIGGRLHFSVTGVQFYSGELHIFGLNNTDPEASVNPSATLICIKE